MSNNNQKSRFQDLSSRLQPILIGVLLILLFSNSTSAIDFLNANFWSGGNQPFTIARSNVTVVPSISINNVSLNEANGGATTTFVFTVSLSAASDQSVSVFFITANGTAVAGEDYILASGTLTFAPGEMSKSLSVTVIGDNSSESNETFTVNLSNAVNATISSGVGTGTILNDDNVSTLQLSRSNDTIDESTGTTTIIVFRMGNATNAVSVNYSTADGTATAGQDYTAASGTLVWGAGESTTKTIDIPITNDSIIEPNETINLTLIGATGGATIGTPATVVLTIVDDDNPYALSINSVWGIEGDSGTKPFNFTVRLLNASSQIVTVDYATADGSAIAGQDYIAVSGTLSFSPSETAKTITVLVKGDTIPEPFESFVVNLSNAVNASISYGQGVGTIDDDDNQPYPSCIYSVSPTNINVGAEASTRNTFSVSARGGVSGCYDFSAKTNSSFITITSSPNLSGIGGPVIFSVAVNTGAARTGTILFSGGNGQFATITVNQAAGTTAARKVLFDFDGDGKSDISVFRPSNGFWYISKSSGGYSFLQWGLATDTLAPGDYDFDGKTDLAVYRRGANNTFYILRSSDNTYTARQLGASGFLGDDSAAPADYDGDGKTDLAVYTGSDAVGAPGNFIIIQSSTNSPVTRQWGLNTDKLVVADYDGDGKDDLAVFRYRAFNQVAEFGTWYILQSTNGAMRVGYFGLPSDTVVPGDYDGDGRADIAVWRPSNGYWYWISSRDGSFNSYQFGQSDDKPVPDDYDGDHKTDFAVYRPSSGVWYLQQSIKGFRAEQFGLPTDIPIPNLFVR